VFITGKPSPQIKSDFVPIPLTRFRLPNFTLTTFIEGCFRSDPGRSDAAADIFRRLPASDEVVWTDDSAVCYPLSTVGTSVHAACRRCLSSSSLSYSVGPVSSTFLSWVPCTLHALELWYHSHLKTCHFQSALSKPTSNRPLPFFYGLGVF